MSYTASVITWKPWTKVDGILTALISLWFDVIQNNDKYVHASLLVYFGFDSTLVYTFCDELISLGLVESKKKKVRSMKYLIAPTPSGITTFLNFYETRLELIRKKEQEFDVRLSIEGIRLEETCQSLKKIQTNLFGNPR